MDNLTAHKKKKVAVSKARIILKVVKARAIRLRAELAAEKVARATKEAAQRARIAADNAERAAIANAAAVEVAAKR